MTEGNGPREPAAAAGEPSQPHGKPNPNPRRAPASPGAVPCDLCGAPMLDRHCKLLCLRCGYQRDCSDP